MSARDVTGPQPAALRGWRPRALVAGTLVAVAVGAPVGATALAGGHPPSARVGKERMIDRVLGSKPAPAPAPSPRSAAAVARATGAARRLPDRSGRIGSQASLGGAPVPFPASFLHVTNMWHEQRAGRYVGVYAGALARDPAHGVVFETSQDPVTGATTVRRLDGPRGAGPLRLTQVRGGVVRFVAARANRPRTLDLGAVLGRRR